MNKLRFVIRTSPGIAALAMLITLGSCSTAQWTQMPAPGLTDSTIHWSKPQPIAAYETADGVKHVFDGIVQVGSDSVRLVQPERPGRGLENGSPEVHRAAARDSVTRLQVKHFDAIRTSLLVIGLVAFTAVILAAGSLAASPPVFF